MTVLIPLFGRYLGGCLETLQGEALLEKCVTRGHVLKFIAGPMCLDRFCLVLVGHKSNVPSTVTFSRSAWKQMAVDKT